MSFWKNHPAAKQPLIRMERAPTTKGPIKNAFVAEQKRKEDKGEGGGVYSGYTSETARGHRKPSGATIKRELEAVERRAKYKFGVGGAAAAGSSEYTGTAGLRPARTQAQVEAGKEASATSKPNVRPVLEVLFGRRMVPGYLQDTEASKAKHTSQQTTKETTTTTTKKKPAAKKASSQEAHKKVSKTTRALTTKQTAHKKTAPTTQTTSTKLASDMLADSSQSPLERSIPVEAPVAAKSALKKRRHSDSSSVDSDEPDTDYAEARPIKRARNTPAVLPSCGSGRTTQEILKTSKSYKSRATGPTTSSFAKSRPRARKGRPATNASFEAQSEVSKITSSTQPANTTAPVAHTQVAGDLVSAGSLSQPEHITSPKAAPAAVDTSKKCPFADDSDSELSVVSPSRFAGFSGFSDLPGSPCAGPDSGGDAPRPTKRVRITSPVPEAAAPDAAVPDAAIPDVPAGNSSMYTSWEEVMADEANFVTTRLPDWMNVENEENKYWFGLKMAQVVARCNAKRAERKRIEREERARGKAERKAALAAERTEKRRREEEDAEEGEGKVSAPKRQKTSASYDTERALISGDESRSKGTSSSAQPQRQKKVPQKKRPSGAMTPRHTRMEEEEELKRALALSLEEGRDARAPVNPWLASLKAQELEEGSD